MSGLSKLGLGTVQWGLDYGVSSHAQTDGLEVARILELAEQSGIKVLDTAPAYGNCEAVLGENALTPFRIVTKTAKLDHSSTSTVNQQLSAGLQRSLHNLNCDVIDSLLVHDCDELFGTHGSELLASLRSFKTIGLIKKIGVSVYTSTQIDQVLSLFVPDIIQLPINVLDQRLLQNHQLDRLKAHGVEIHARSVFLQGLLLMPMQDIPVQLQQFQPQLQVWHQRVAAQSLSLTSAALAFVRELPQIDTVLVGVNDAQQFVQIAEDFAAEVHFDAAGLASDTLELINPMLWERAA